MRIAYISSLNIINPSVYTFVVLSCEEDVEIRLNRYHLKDVIVGKIYFLLVRIKIKHMELSIIRRETTGAPPNQYNESETITKFEIMDGAPVRGLLALHSLISYNITNVVVLGETIPIRLFLGGFDLTPTFRDVNKKFSTRYYLNLVLIDEENRRYFKQQVRVLSLFVDRRTYASSTYSGDHNIQDSRSTSDPAILPIENG